jgi:glycosyltransferase involved in cell wall biosynthesis
MQESRKISVITPSFNQAAFIERTILSVTSQEVDVPVEHIVMDGGSTDGTLDILRGYSGRITFVSEPDKGMPDAVNKGFALAGGDILGWLNSDDIYLPGTLQKVVAYFDRNPERLWVYGNCRIIDGNDREVRQWITRYKNRSAKNYSYPRLLVENFISQPAVFFRAEALKRAGYLDTSLPTAMDFDLWLRLGKLGKPGYINDDLACFRVHQGSISARSYREQFEEQYRIHLRYDQTRSLLLKHRLKIRGIVFIYGLLQKFSGTPPRSSS